jgi:hypothetical protein
VLLDRRDRLDFQQEVWIGQSLRADRFTFWRRWAEVARQQISVFVELGRRRNQERYLQLLREAGLPE